MTTVSITLLFSDGAARRIDGQCGESVVQAASKAGLGLLTDCSNGKCGTCAATLVSGDIELGEYDRAVLPDDDRAGGAILTCISRILAPCVVELPYELAEATAEELPPMAGCIAAMEQVASETVRLEVGVDAEVEFQPGQYVRIRPEGSEEWRSYSMACVSRTRMLVFYIRLVEGGYFSSWLAQSAQVGSRLELSEPHGSFFLRKEARPRLFVAGGTGLAPFLAMLESVADDPAERQIPTALLVGVRTGAHLFAQSQLQALKQKWPSLQVRLAAEAEPAESCHTGYATELIAGLGMPADTRVYLCGPPAMVEAGRSAAQAAGMPRRDMLCERFT